jgi:hypothetical protein
MLNSLPLEEIEEEATEETLSIYKKLYLFENINILIHTIISYMGSKVCNYNIFTNNCY